MTQYKIDEIPSNNGFPNTLTAMLDAMDTSVLDFEREWASRVGPKDRNIEYVLGLTSEAYYRRLRRLVFDERARAYDPLTMQRLARLIEPATRMEAVG